jgi:hypothetical protein
MHELENVLLGSHLYITEIYGKSIFDIECIFLFFPPTYSFPSLVQLILKVLKFRILFLTFKTRNSFNLFVQFHITCVGQHGHHEAH